MTLEKKIELIEELNRYRLEFTKNNPFNQDEYNAEDYIVMREVYVFVRYKEGRVKND